MDRIGIVGISLHETDVAGLERFARPAESAYELFARELADELGASELVLLLTCNRIEVIFARELGHLPATIDRDRTAERLGLTPADPLRESMHLLTGRDAVRHLFRVASSLDSLVLGEDQILAQVREAYQRCCRAGLVGRLLGGLFEHALQVAKQVHTQTDLSRIPVSIVSLGLDAIASRFPDAAPTIALIGAGAMAELVVKNATAQGLAFSVIANRSPAKAADLASRCGAQAMSLEDWEHSPACYDVLIAATAAPGCVVSRAQLLKLAERTPQGKPLLALDLALPRDIESTADPCVEIIDLEALRTLAASQRALRAVAAEAAETFIEHKLAAYARRATEATIQEAITEMQLESTSIFERELARLFTGKLARMSDEERQTVESWARAAFGRVAHVPISALKRLAADPALHGAQDSEGVA